MRTTEMVQVNKTREMDRKDSLSQVAEEVGETKRIVEALRNEIRRFDFAGRTKESFVESSDAKRTEQNVQELQLSKSEEFKGDPNEQENVSDKIDRLQNALILLKADLQEERCQRRSDCQSFKKERRESVMSERWKSDHEQNAADIRVKGPTALERSINEMKSAVHKVYLSGRSMDSGQSFITRDVCHKKVPRKTNMSLEDCNDSVFSNFCLFVCYAARRETIERRTVLGIQKRKVRAETRRGTMTDKQISIL